LFESDLLEQDLETQVIAKGIEHKLDV